MLKQLDTLIGFVVVMAIVSLLITVITQAVSTALGLRGLNLADALEAMFYTISPQINPDSSRLLIRKLLTHPATSDSILPAGKPAMFLRRWNPPWWQWLTNRWKLASAIRPDEILSLLEKKADLKADAAQAWINQYRVEAGALLVQFTTFQNGRDPALRPLLSPLLQELQSAAAPPQGAQAIAAAATPPSNQAWINNFMDALEPLGPAAMDAATKAAQAVAAPKDEALRKAADETRADFVQLAESIQFKITATRILADLNHTPPAAATALAALEHALPELAKTRGAAVIQEFVAAKDIALTNLEKWFNSAQDRAQGWFATHMRIVTIVCSIIVAFILQLDTILLFKQISSDTDLRDKLVATGLSGPFQTQASNLVTATITDGVDATTHGEVMKEILGMKAFQDLPADLAKPTNFLSLADAQSWLAESVTNATVATSLTNEYQQLILKKRLTELDSSFQDILNASQQGGLQLLPDPYPPFFNADWPKPHWFWFFSGKWSWPWPHLLGIICSAALLSLGAPFWFNALKTLANLRPTVANEVDKDPKQLPAQPPPAKT